VTDFFLDKFPLTSSYWQYFVTSTKSQHRPAVGINIYGWKGSNDDRPSLITPIIIISPSSFGKIYPTSVSGYPAMVAGIN